MLNIGSKTLRNLPEQVAENMKQIGLIWQKLDGLDVYDNVIIIEDVSNLNEEQLAIVARPVSFIVYQDVVYVKKGNVGAYALFSPYYSIEADEYITIKSSELRVQFPLGEVIISGLEVELYAKDETDTLLVDKADKNDTYTKNEVNALLLSKVYPVGAVFASVENTSPASLFGGTWEILNSGNQLHLVKSAKMQVYTGEDNALSSPRDALSFRNNYNNLKPTTNRTLGLSATGGDLIDQGNGNTSNTGYYPSNLYADVDIDVGLYVWKRVA